MFRRLFSKVVDKDFVLYENKNTATVRAAYFAAGAQIFFWLSMADLSLRNLIEDDKDGKKVLAPLQNRVGMAIFCGATSFVFPVLVQYYCFRRVSKIVALKGGNEIAVYNSARIGNTVRVFKRSALKSSFPLNAPNHKSLFITANSGKATTKFLVERTGDNITVNAAVFDSFFLK
jgi:hypothetical protein